ncbi:hypothetical protein CK203_049769 [Vitis vinifera]|uniref:Integrase zinc-binding domain-containing protein n=1 Tax=Vitis vinifera TaxID=29760 RepID=A0A438H1Q1_VITVI|nr:hypothetical protein CK203_049769 [Vitis vinifera]
MDSFVTRVQSPIRDKKGVENVVADHLSRLAIAHNSHVLPISDDFPEESLMLLEKAPWYAHIANYLVTSEVPSEWNAQDRKHFFAKIHAYYWEESFLFKYGADQIIRKCVPEEERQGILSHCHENACEGHFASQKTAMKVLQSGFTWPSLFKDSHIMYYVSKWVEAIRCKHNDHRVVLKFLKNSLQDYSWYVSLSPSLWQSMHLPVEVEYKAWWAIKKLNMDLIRAGAKRCLDLNEIEELRNDAYINSKVAKTEDEEGISSQVNGHCLKPFIKPFKPENEESTSLSHIKPNQIRKNCKKIKGKSFGVRKSGKTGEKQRVQKERTPEQPFVSLSRLSPKPCEPPAITFGHFLQSAMARTKGAKSSFPTGRKRVAREASVQGSTSEPPRQVAAPPPAEPASLSPLARRYQTRSGGRPPKKKPRVVDSEPIDLTEPSPEPFPEPSPAPFSEPPVEPQPPIEGNLDCQARPFTLSYVFIFTKRFGEFREIFDKPPIEPNMAKELPYSFDSHWRWKLDNKFNLCFVHFNAFLGDDMLKDNSLVYHEMTFLSVKHQIFLNASTQNSFQVD